MPSFQFNAESHVAAARPERGPLPRGMYQVIVMASDLKPTQAGTGQYIELTLQIVDGEHAGRRLWDRLNVSNPNKTAEDIAKRQLQELCLATGVTNLLFIYARNPSPVQWMKEHLKALVGAGIVTGISGERAELVEAAEEDHYSHMECGAEADKYFDKHPNNAVSLKSATLATITVRDGKMIATLSGLDAPVEKVTIPASSPVQVLFHNLDSEEHRLVAELGEKKVADTGVKEKSEQCTQLTGEDQVNVLTLNIRKPSIAAGPYKLTVPGLEGQEIEVYVP